MVKRIFVGIIIGAFLVVGIGYYYFNKKAPVVDSVFKAVPLDAALLIDIKDFNELNQNLMANKQVWGDFSALPFLDMVNQRVKLIDSLKKAFPQINSMFNAKHPFLISGHPRGKDNIEFIYYFKIEDAGDYQQIDQIIRGHQGKTLDYSTRSYDHVDIHDISFPINKGNNFSYGWARGLLMLSKSSILLEDAIRQLSAQESILNGKGLNEIVKTAGKNSLANFYLNFEHFPRLAQQLIHAKYKKDLVFMKHFGNWIELDLNMKPGLLVFNGFSIAGGANPSFELVFRNQNPTRFEAFNKIPSTASTFFVLGISKLSQYFSDYELLLETSGDLQEYKSALKELKDQYKIDLAGSFNDIFEKEACAVFMDGVSDTLANGAFSILRVKGADETAKVLTAIVAEYANKHKLKIKDLITKEKRDNDQELQCWSLPMGNIPALLFGKLFSAGENSCCTLLDNYLIFGQSRQSILQYLKSLNHDASIGADLEFNSFSEHFSSQSNYFFYSKPVPSLGIYSHFLKQDLFNELSRKQSHLGRVNTIVYQFNSSDNHLIYHNLFLKYTSDNLPNQVKAEVSGNEVKLDAKLIMKPVLIKNPATKENEIFVQDEKNQVYLINRLGRVLWKVGLKEPIKSGVFPIDFYKNGKLQFMFSTHTQLYLIDRNGNYVEKFPVKLPKPATNGIAVFDYDKKRDYRIFVACNNRKIYVLDKTGEPIEKWEFDKTDDEVTQPVQFFQIEGKDHLVFNDQSNLYMVDRKGNMLAKPVLPFIISANNKTSLVNPRSKKEARLVVTDTEGKVYLVGLDGKTKTVDCGKYPENHWFDVYDVDNDGVKDFVFTWGNDLKTFSQKGNQMFAVHLDQSISYRPVFYEFSKNSCKIGIVSASDEKAYLYNGAGNLSVGFPVKGNTQFTLDLVNNSENKINLIVGSGDNFLNQYSVQ